MILYNGNKEIKLELNDESYSYEAIKGEDTLTLYFSYPGYLEVPVGSWCDFYGKRYSLKKDSNFKKNGERNFEYILILETAKADAMLWKVRNTVDNRIKFPYTAKPEEHLRLLVENLNRRGIGWKVGDCIEGVEKAINYSHTYVLDALNQLAELYETEWQIKEEAVEGKPIKTIHLRKVEYNKDNPLKLSYGKGHGFKTGVGRESGDIPPEIILVETTDRNIDYSTYKAKNLLLPKSQTIRFDGTKFENEEGFDSTKARIYMTDADGTSVMRADKELTTCKEESLDCTEIYPSRVGTVSSVIEVNKENNSYDFVDKDIPESLDFEKCLIAGENMTVIFQTGMLVGKEFEVKYIHKAKDKKEARRFEIVPQEIDGITMPESDVWKPQFGDTYAVFGMQLPESYVCDNITKTGASWEVFKQAAKYLYEHEDKKFTFTGTLDGIWAKKRWLQVGGKIVLGGYVDFCDTQFHPEGSLIRMIGIKRYVNNPYSPEIELSNEPVGTSVSSELNKIETNEVTVDKNYKDSLQFSKRRFRDAKETMKMLEDALLNFSGSINPITVQTMQLLVGDESLQFRFVNSMTVPVQVEHVIKYDTSTKILNVPEGVIQHMTLGITSVSSSHKTDEYKFWLMPEYNSPKLLDAGVKYYLYAKVSTSDKTGTFFLSEKAIKLEQISGYYHLLVGVLNSEQDGERSFVELYGFTEVLPGRITTDRIVSSDGLNFMDFVNNAFRVGNEKNYFDWNSKSDGKLRLKGTIIQSESGDESPIGCFRGVYNSSYTYYWGDEVTFTVSNVTSTYRYVNKIPTEGKAPTDGIYWTIVAEGTKGEDGMDGVPGKDGADGVIYYTWIRYADNASGNGISNNPSGKLYIGFAYKKTTAVESNFPSDYQWSRFRGEDGTDGIPGAPGEDGQTTYTWMAYSNYSDGRDMYQIPNDDTKYIGIAINKETKTESSNPSDYTWSKFKGEDGTAGDYFEYRYAVSGSRTTPPSLVVTDIVPSGWSTSMPDVVSLQYLWMTVSKKSASGELLQNWSVPVRHTPYDGVDGKDGENAPNSVFRGIYSSSTIYYGTPNRVDIVKYNDHYYIARTDAGDGFIGKSPDNTNYWNTFGAEFESVATQLLLAEYANIASFIFKNQRMESQGSTNNIPNIILDGLNNMASFAAGKVKFENDKALIGWLQVVGTDLVGYDENKEERIKITSSVLPSISSLVKLIRLSFTAGASSSSVDIDSDGESMYASCQGYRMEIRDAWDNTSIDENNDFSCYIDFTVEEDYLEAIFDPQFGVTGANVDSCECYLDLYTGSTKVASGKLSNRMSVMLNKGKYKAIFSMYAYSSTDWRGEMYVSMQGFVLNKRAQQTIIGNDGILSTFNGNYLKMQSSDGFEVKIGNYGLRINSSNGMQKTTNNGSSWTSL